jgi:hypothetical protein
MSKQSGPRIEEFFGRTFLEVNHTQDDDPYNP